ncbi:MAG TPA: hypothetical protein VIM30_00590 [Candidatus Limnocylindrales bacterium]|jgi:hypothetical protein
MNPIPRSEISIGIDPALRGRLGAIASSGSLVLDYFASRRCSVTVGDLTADVRTDAPGSGFVELAPVEGVRLYAQVRLLPILREAGPSLRLGRGVFGRHLAVGLEQPERWIAFLEEPGVLARRRPFRSAH